MRDLITVGEGTKRLDSCRVTYTQMRRRGRGHKDTGQKGKRVGNDKEQKKGEENKLREKNTRKKLRSDCAAKFITRGSGTEGSAQTTQNLQFGCRNKTRTVGKRLTNL